MLGGKKKQKKNLCGGQKGQMWHVPSTNPLPRSVFHRDWRHGVMANTRVAAFSLRGPLSFDEVV